MRRLFYKIKENKHIIAPITILVVSFIVFAGGLTYAYFDFAIERSDVSSLKVTGTDFDILVVGTGINSVNDMPIYDEYKDSQSNKYNFTVKNNSEKMNACYSVSFYVSSISEYLRNETFKWEIVDNTNSLIQSGNFSGITPTTKMPLFVDRNLEKNQTINYTLKLWLSHSDTVDQFSALGGSIQGNIVVEASGEFCGELATARFEYFGAPQPYVAPADGVYKVQLWGAQGGESSSKGAYTEGKIILPKGTKFYINVGENTSSTNFISYNGGESTGGSYAGGGSTDLRIVGGSWNDINGINSRIMVAAGGGSGNSTGVNGAGGGLIGYPGGGGNTGGTQTTPGTQTAFQLTNFPAFGIAGGGCTGGNGYYPGGGGNCSDGAGGGSSYISGHAGCIAIAQGSETIPSRAIKSGCSASSTSVACSLHYSEYEFFDTIMIDGAGYSWTTTKGNRIQMPSISGGYYNLGEGKSGDGYAKITLIEYNRELSHYLTINLDGGSLAGNASGSYAEGQIYSFNIPTKDGYVFAGWEITDGLGYSIEGNNIQIGFNDGTIKALWMDYERSNLVLYYDGINNTADGHSNSVTTWYDLSGNDKNGTLQNFAMTSTSGWSNDSLIYDGAADRVSIGNHLVDLFKSDNTIEVTVKFDDGGAIDVIIGNYSAANSIDYFRGTDDTIRVYFNAGNFESGYLNNGILPINNKMLLSFVYDKTNSKIYVYKNGVLMQNFPLEDALFGSYNYNFSAVYLGSDRRTDDKCLKGSIYSLRVYSRALSEAEIDNNYEVDAIRFGL